MCYTISRSPLAHASTRRLRPVSSAVCALPMAVPSCSRLSVHAVAGSCSIAVSSVSVMVMVMVQPTVYFALRHTRLIC